MNEALTFEEKMQQVIDNYQPCRARTLDKYYKTVLANGIKWVGKKMKASVAQMDADELASLANITLTKCMRSHDPSKGSLQTYFNAALRYEVFEAISGVYTNTSTHGALVKFDHASISFVEEDEDCEGFCKANGEVAMHESDPWSGTPTPDERLTVVLGETVAQFIEDTASKTGLAVADVIRCILKHEIADYADMSARLVAYFGEHDPESSYVAELASKAQKARWVIKEHEFNVNDFQSQRAIKWTDLDQQYFSTRAAKGKRVNKAKAKSKRFDVLVPSYIRMIYKTAHKQVGATVADLLAGSVKAFMDKRAVLDTLNGVDQTAPGYGRELREFLTSKPDLSGPYSNIFYSHYWMLFICIHLQAPGVAAGGNISSASSPCIESVHNGTRPWLVHYLFPTTGNFSF